MGLWWGGNLIGARDAPVQLSNPRRLIYSPHAYGPGVFQQPYFKDPTFPLNMPAVWEQHWGFVAKQTGQPIVLGEMGGWYKGCAAFGARARSCSSTALCSTRSWLLPLILPLSVHPLLGTSSSAALTRSGKTGPSSTSSSTTSASSTLPSTLLPRIPAASF